MKVVLWLWPRSDSVVRVQELVTSTCQKGKAGKAKLESKQTVFFSSGGFLHKVFVPQGQNVKWYFFTGALRCLKEDIGRKLQNMCFTQSWLIRHDNTPPPYSIDCSPVLTENNMAVFLYHIFTPKKGPSDFFTFLRMETQVQGAWFEDIAQIDVESLAVLDSVKKWDFQRWLQELEKSCTQYVHSEGDNTDL